MILRTSPHIKKEKFALNLSIGFSLQPNFISRLACLRLGEDGPDRGDAVELGHALEVRAPPEALGALAPRPVLHDLAVRVGAAGRAQAAGVPAQPVHAGLGHGALCV